MAQSKGENHFRKLQSFDTEYSTSVITQYESSRTGMRAIIIDRKGPKVQGYFALATEIFDDSGAPHTLEHLIFMGSKSYRYKGFLDKLATRAYSFTNAWTATDHTAYTLETAGWDGFAQILPVYLEHVLLPTLTDSACYTEVHHIDGEGNDAGVVYSEMQGIQNDQNSLMDLKARRLLYPKDVGFRYETGGMMEQLRVLTADRIREFHKAMYQPKNLCLVVAGEADHSNFLDILETFESSILSDIPSIQEPWKRPWTESPQPPPISESIIEVVEFPEEDESVGEVQVAFFGPDVNDTLQTTALSICLQYLAGSSVSILENTIVEKEALSSGIFHNTDGRPNSVIWFSLTGVQTELLAKVEKRFFEVLKEAIGSSFDSVYMKDCVNRMRIQIKASVEESAYLLSESVIRDHLFGNRNGSTLRDLKTLEEFDVLSKWPESEWKGFISKWFTNAPHISILGTPSASMSKKLKEDEESRIKQRKEELGEPGLKKLAEKLEEAKKQNNLEIPQSLLDSFPIPGVDSIHFIETTTARSGKAKQMGHLDNEVQKKVDADKSTSPLFLHFEHTPSNFIYTTLIISTAKVPVELRPLLPIYFENFFNTPVRRNGELVLFEKVVKQLEQDTISYNIRQGGGGGIPETVRIAFQCEPEKYVTTINWIRELFVDSVFDPVRLTAAVTKLLADIPEEKRDGSSMMGSVAVQVHYGRESIAKASDTLVKASYLKRVKKLLKDNPDEIISQMETLRLSLFQFVNLRTLVIGNVLNLSEPAASWNSLTEGLDTSLPVNPIDNVRDRLSPLGKAPGNSALLVPMPTVDSSFSLHTTSGPSSYSDPRLPALMVAMAYLDAAEGPMWTATRGTGLAYGTTFSRSIETGMLRFRVYRSPNTFRAFEAGRKVVRDLVDGTSKFDPSELEGAISSIVVGFADEEPTMASAAHVSFLNQVARGLDKDYNTQILKKVRAVGVEEIRSVMKEVLLPVFEPKTSSVVITCATVLAKDIQESFEKEGFKIDVKALNDFQDDYGLGGADEGDEESEGSEEGDSGDDEDGAAAHDEL